MRGKWRRNGGKRGWQGERGGDEDRKGREERWEQGLKMNEADEEEEKKEDGGGVKENGKQREN